MPDGFSGFVETYHHRIMIDGGQPPCPIRPELSRRPGAAWLPDRPHLISCLRPSKRIRIRDSAASLSRGMKAQAVGSAHQLTPGENDSQAESATDSLKIEPNAGSWNSSKPVIRVAMAFPFAWQRHAPFRTPARGPAISCVLMECWLSWAKHPRIRARSRPTTTACLVFSIFWPPRAGSLASVAWWVLRHAVAMQLRSPPHTE